MTTRSHGPARRPAVLGNGVEHVLTRAVRAAAAVLDAVYGSMTVDCFAAPPPSRLYRDEAGVDPGRVRVSLLLHHPFLEQPIDPECLAAVRGTGRL